LGLLTIAGIRPVAVSAEEKKIESVCDAFLSGAKLKWNTDSKASPGSKLADDGKPLTTKATMNGFVSGGLKTFKSYQFENPSGRRDDVKHCLLTGNKRSVDAGVERGETLPPVLHGKRQKKGVGEMLGCLDAGNFGWSWSSVSVRSSGQNWCPGAAIRRESSRRTSIGLPRVLGSMELCGG